MQKFWENQKLFVAGMYKKYKLKKVTGTGSVISQIDEARFTIDYRNQLNASQYEAVSKIDGTYLIIAGAGSGKTRTLVYRLARLIEMGYDPNSILLLTFTRKAAREMMNRASILLDDRCSKVRGGTFHSFANTTLRKYAKVIGLEPNFTILDQGDSEDVINLIRTKSTLVEKEKRFPNKSTLFKIFSLSVNSSKSVENIVEEDYPHFFYELEKILAIQKIYTDYKRKNNLLDYDDLLLFLKDFLHSNSEVVNHFINEISFIMVDEYQDTNYLQAEIVKGLAQKNNNVMVVGDDSQSIYSFRGANFKNIMNFPSLFPGTEIIKLEENYRSTPEILTFANQIVEKAIEKYEKYLFSRKKSGELPYIIAAVNESLQSRFIVEKILELREEGVSLNDIAVLFRSSFFSFDLEIELTKANIPFVKVGGMKFIETAHIKDVLAFLRILENPKDVVSWYRVLMLHEGIGPKSAEKILDMISRGLIQINKNPEHIKEDKLMNKVFPLFELIYRLNKGSYSPTEAAQIILDYYYPIFREIYDDFNKRKKDLDIFLNISENYSNLSTLLADMALEPPVESAVDIENEDKHDDILTLSTIHSAKGLEWHSVFVIHAVEGFFPMSRAAESLDQIEEERRLMYVAVTRARQNLFVTFPMNMYDRESGRVFSKPSRFISDINTDLAQGYLLEE